MPGPDDSLGNDYTHRRTWDDPLVDPERDRQVCWRGHPIGRVRFDDITPKGAHWVWSCHFNVIIHDQIGSVATRDQALEEVRLRHEREGCPGPHIGCRPPKPV